MYERLTIEPNRTLTALQEWAADSGVPLEVAIRAMDEFSNAWYIEDQIEEFLTNPPTVGVYGSREEWARGIVLDDRIAGYPNINRQDYVRFDVQGWAAGAVEGRQAADAYQVFDYVLFCNVMDSLGYVVFHTLPDGVLVLASKR